MAIDIAVPTPPDLTNRSTPAAVEADLDAGELDLRRGELEAILRDGAWREGVEEWAQYTDCTAADVELAETLGIFRGFDFYWDGEAERLRYVVPAVPESWAERAADEALSAPVLQEELDDLGRTVAETIATDYVDWGAAETSDLVWGVESFGQVPTGEGE